MNILVTGFDPFGGETINPAWEAVCSLPDQIHGHQVFKRELPTCFHRSADVLFAAMKDVSPDLVLCVGQAGGRAGVTIERVGINIDDARITDNDGNQPIDTPITPDGPAAYLSNLPIKAMVRSARDAGIPAAVSNTAGTFVCNHILYQTLHHIATNQLNTKGGFIHVPFLPQQVVDKPNTPSMDQMSIVIGLTAMIEAAITFDQDIAETGGTEC